MNLRPCCALVAVLCASFVPSNTVGGPERERTSRAVQSERFDREIFFAVLEGLYGDGLSNETVDALVALDPLSGWPANFVQACPICMPAFDAFRLYRSRSGFYCSKPPRDTFGEGLAPELDERLNRADVTVRQTALRQLVEGWIGKRMDSLRLTPDERRDWKDEMALRRKRGNELLEDYRAKGISSAYAAMKTCAFCEAANGACEKR